MKHEGPVRVRLRYADLETFIERFAPNVSRGGLFIASRNPRRPGDIFRFEIQLADGQVVLAGDGKVTWVKEFNPAEAKKPHGMGVQFVRVDPESRPLLERILRFKGQSRAARAPGRATPSGPIQVRDTSAPELVPDVPSARHVPGDEGKLDADIDALVKQLGIDDVALRRTLDRARLSGARLEDLASLEASSPEEPLSLSQALAELPRLLSRGAEPGNGRRRAGSSRATGAGLRTPAPVDGIDPERPAVSVGSGPLRSSDDAAQVSNEVFAAVDRLQKA